MERWKMNIPFFIASSVRNRLALLMGIRMSVWLSASSSFAAAAPVVVPKLTRGPYLQMGSHTNMVIRWRTDIPCASIVMYGTNTLSSKATSAGVLTEHVVQLTDLIPLREYYY